MDDRQRMKWNSTGLNYTIELETTKISNFIEFFDSNGRKMGSVEPRPNLDPTLGGNRLS